MLYGTMKESLTVLCLEDMSNSIHEELEKPNNYAYLSTIDFSKAFDLVKMLSVNKLD